MLLSGLGVWLINCSVLTAFVLVSLLFCLVFDLVVLVF